MPENNPPAVDEHIHHYFAGLIHLVYVQVEIIVDDITCRRYQYRSNHQENELPGIWYLAGIIAVNLFIDTVLKQYLGKYYEDQVRPSYQPEKSSDYFQNGHLCNTR